MEQHKHHHHHHHSHHHDEDKKRSREVEAHSKAVGHKEEHSKKMRTAEVSPLVAASKWAEMASSTTVADLVQRRHRKPGHLVAVDGDFTVGAVMDLLARYDLLSAPVIDPRSRRFLGFIDVLDVAGYESHLSSRLVAQHSHEILYVETHPGTSWPRTARTLMIPIS
jgi:hypothetical protein